MPAALFNGPMTLSSCHNSDFLYKHNLIKTATLVCGRASQSSPPIKSSKGCLTDNSHFELKSERSGG